MKYPPGARNASPVRADQSITGLSAAPVTGGTATTVRPGGTSGRHAPSATNSGTGATGTARIGVGARGSNAAATAPAQSSRTGSTGAAGGRRAARTRSTESATRTPSTGTQTRANRAGTARSNSGSPATSRYGPGMPVAVPSTRSSVPSDSGAKTMPQPASARTSGRRHSQITMTTARTSSPGPKNEFSSVGFGESSPGSQSSPSTVCRADAVNDAASSWKPCAAKAIPE